MYTYKYPRPMVAVDTVLFERQENQPVRILLIKRGNDPFKNCWALPGGFVEMDEDLPDAAKRELREETSVEISTLHQVGAFGDPSRDPRGRNISIVYSTIVHEEISPNAGDDAKEAQMFDLDKLPKLAFDHDIIISSAMNTLKIHQK